MAEWFVKIQKIHRWLRFAVLSVLSSPCRLDFFDFEKIKNLADKSFNG